MIRLLTVFFLVCLSICSIKSQSKINCSKEEKYTKRVSIQSGKNYAANISGKMCYNYNRNILISVSSIYSVNDNVLTQKKAEGQGHKLYLVNVEHNAVDAYVLNYPDPTQEIKDTLWLMLKAKDDAYWTAKRMELTLKFLYIRKKAGQEQEFVLDFALPDHPKPVEKSKVDSALMDSIHAAAKESSPQVKKKRRVRKPVVKYPKTDEFLDSIRFYFKNMSTLYDEVADHSALGTEDKDQFEQRYHVCVERFNHFSDQCEDSNLNEFKGEFERLARYVSKSINTESTTANVHNSSENNNDTIDKSQEKETKKNKFRLKDWYRYIIGLIVIVVIAIYVYSKVKKKIK